MRKSREIIGLSVISIQEGKELGVVKQLVIDSAAGSVIALLIDDGKWYLGAKALPFSATSGLGEYAVTINSEKDIVEASTFDVHLSKGIEVVGALVVTRDGNVTGTTSEIVIDESGKIVECIVENSKETFSIPAHQVITYGKDVVIITTDSDLPAIAQETVVAAHNPVIEDSGLYIDADQQHSQVEPTESDALAKMFEEKQRKYMLGKRASRRIDAENGVTIVEQGEEITEIILEKAKLSGKFVELSMSIY